MKIQFLANDADYAAAFDAPQPASSFLPDWYKRQGGFVNNDRSITPAGLHASTIKHCMPAFDAMTAGYIWCTPCDIHVTQNDQINGVSTAWPVDRKIIESHSPEQVSEYEIDKTVWNPAVLKLISEWTIVTPPGYSTLFVAPLWQEENRFVAFPGVVDTDLYPRPVNFPFLVRNGFVGTIPNNTPFIQMIPFKRETWESRAGVNTQENWRRWVRASRDTIFRYKKNFRVPKKWS